MKITSSYIDINSYQPVTHPSGCLCASCCKNGSAGQSEELADQKKQDNTPSNKTTDLTSSERHQLSQLQQRDSEVRAHEAAHIASGGSVISGGASFTYQEGPDGKLYAIGGEVPISISSGSTPQESIEIAKQVQAAALAPANPSPQDLKVAASATMMETRARQELAQIRTEEMKIGSGTQTYANNQDHNTDDHSLDLLA